MNTSQRLSCISAIGASLIVALPATALTNTQKAATAYWKAACDIKHGQILKSQGGAQAEKYMRELGVNPAVAYADANATTTAEMLDKAAGTNCFR